MVHEGHAAAGDGMLARGQLAELAAIRKGMVIDTAREIGRLLAAQDLEHGYDSAPSDEYCEALHALDSERQQL